MLIKSLAIMIAYYIDLLMGDPPKFPHPVKLFGWYLNQTDKWFNKGPLKKFLGTLSLLSLVFLVFVSSFYLLFLLYRINFYLGLAVEAFLISTTIANKGLTDAAKAVLHPLESGDLNKARRQLSSIVGRDTVDLPEEEIVRATIETVAENTSDGVTAPLFWAFIGGAPLALVYRAVNTADSMHGYKTERYERFGWAAARLDDVLNFIPARLTGLIMPLTVNSQVPLVRRYKVLFRDAKKHASPNSGWNEAALAASLGIQLGGKNTYQGKVTESSKLGDSLIKLNRRQITQAIYIMKRTVVVMIIGGVLLVLSFTRF